MQIFFLPTWLAVALSFVLWFIFQVGAALVCYVLPNSFFDKDGMLFKIRKFEQNGEIYQKIFRLRRWKRFLPDGAAWTGGYAKRHLHGYSKENLQMFLRESRRAELVHWLAILPFWVFGFFSPLYVVFLMLVYALVLNLPCAIVQRYNRPRILRLIAKRYPASTPQQLPTPPKKLLTSQPITTYTDTEDYIIPPVT